jgi:hypothetical protein
MSEVSNAARVPVIVTRENWTGCYTVRRWNGHRYELVDTFFFRFCAVRFAKECMNKKFIDGEMKVWP